MYSQKHLKIVQILLKGERALKRKVRQGKRQHEKTSKLAKGGWN